MVKNLITEYLESWLGEYILNVPKEQIKVAALRGRIKVENVQLDGDLIGSEIMGAVGLSGFGILSCSAKSMQMVVPWTNLEKEPTRFQLTGVHLVCVPLLPSNATRMHGGCTLRTHAKRSALARLERIHFSKRIQAEKTKLTPDEISNNKIQGKGSHHKRKKSLKKEKKVSDEWSDRKAVSSEEKKDDNSEGSEKMTWKEKAMRFKQKLNRNIEIKISDLHLRCEVCEGALDDASSHGSTKQTSAKTYADNVSDESNILPDSSFAFGFTLSNAMYKTANDKWETGNINWDDEDRASPPKKTFKSPPEVTWRKVGNIGKLAMYWDDQPPFLISESAYLKANDHHLTASKLQQKVTTAMGIMAKWQDPGEEVRNSFIPGKKGGKCRTFSSYGKEHTYCALPSSFEIRFLFNTISSSGGKTCLAELLPSHLDFRFNSKQHRQYLKLRSSMMRQQRLDTMLHQRPLDRPTKDPRAWWKYVLSCVVARPNSRPWRDVIQITRSRSKYIVLAKQKILNTRESNGYHSGLSVSDSKELLKLEDLLPIEALMSFHLIVIRKIWELKECGLDSAIKSTMFSSLRKSIFRRSRSSKELNKIGISHGHSSDNLISSLTPINSTFYDSILEKTSLDERKSSKIERPVITVMKTMIRVHNISLSVQLLDISKKSPIIQVDIHASGCVKTTVDGNTILRFDLKNVEVEDYIENLSNVERTKILTFVGIKSFNHPKAGQSYQSMQLEPIDEKVNTLFSPDSSQTHLQPNSIVEDPLDILDEAVLTGNGDVPFPPSGVACRILALATGSSLSLNMSAHPATLVWKRNTLLSLARFFDTPSTVFRGQLQNATTPLAQKAQLALMSPLSLFFNMNIAVPKLWIPVSSQPSDGSLFLNAGRLKISFSKPELQTKTKWQLDVSEILVKFRREKTAIFEYNDTDVRLSQSFTLFKTSYSVESPIEIPVIQPFHVHLVADLCGEDPTFCEKPICRDGENCINDPSIIATSRVRVELGEICLSLVDAEILAKAIGKWYAAGLLSVKQRSQVQKIYDPMNDGNVSKSNVKQAQTLDKIVNVRKKLKPLELSFSVKKIEMTLEGEPLENKASTPKISNAYRRTYLVRLSRIQLNKLGGYHESTSRLSVNDAFIVQMKDSKAEGNVRVIYPSTEPKHQILVQRRNILIAPDNDISHNYQKNRGVITASLTHNSGNHSNDVEIDLNSIALRITPTSLRDVLDGLQRIFELLEISTKEMERRVHEQGRSARKRGNYIRSKNQLMKEKDRIELTDSSLLLKVTLHDAAILAGRSLVPSSNFSSQTYDHDAAIQVLSNVLIMYQSIENPDASGTKTIHISIDNLSSSINTKFDLIPIATSPPMTGPITAEFRRVSTTVNLGMVVSQDISLDLDSLKSCMTSDDLTIMKDITFAMIERFLSFGSKKNDKLLMKYKRKGKGIAESIRFEFQELSFILLQSLELGVRPLFDFSLQGVKGKLEGCSSALAGELSVISEVNFFNIVLSEWESAVEPFSVTVLVDQIPNELILNVTTPSFINSNLTGALLSGIAEIHYDFFGSKHDRKPEKLKKKNALSDEVLIKGKTSHSSQTISFFNESGIDIIIYPTRCVESIGRKSKQELDKINSTYHLIKDGDRTTEKYSNFENNNTFLTLSVAPTSEKVVGKREPISCLPIVTNRATSVSLHRLKPDIQKRKDKESYHRHNLQPVVEWCMQNQRLKSFCHSGVSSIKTGKDLLSSTVWSPGDDAILDEENFTSKYLNWKKPHLKEDVAEWTDLTCVLRMERDGVMLPDDDWIWVDEWKVDIQGKYGFTTDADGWEYETDFERFNRSKRFFKKNDLVRRRKWTRTRMKCSPKFDDPLRPLSLIWQSLQDGNGDYNVKISTPLIICNNTDIELSFIGSCHSWKEEKVVATVNSGEKVAVPIQYSSCTYLRLAIKKSNNGKCENNKEKINIMKKFSLGERLMILSTSYESSSLIRTSLCQVEDHGATQVENESKIFHFSVYINFENCVCSIIVEPVIKIVNLLPCQLQYRIGESARIYDNIVCTNSVIKTEEKVIMIGGESQCLFVDPKLKPYISLRVPGYKWCSPWQRIVNRKKSVDTWKMSEKDVEGQFQNNVDDSDSANEYKSLISFDPLVEAGDKLTLIMSVEAGNVPILRIYAQYWILDKSGFGLTFSDSFTDLLGTIPSPETSRHSYFSQESCKVISDEKNLLGHQWPIGMSGMSLFFSLKERIIVAIESRNEGIDSDSYTSEQVISHWVSPLDISNVTPKVVFTLDERDGDRLFELSYFVTMCPTIFSRTKCITFIPRFQIVNLLKRNLYIVQDRCLNEISVPAQSSIFYHWESASSPHKVHFSARTFLDDSSITTEAGIKQENPTTIGAIRLDKIGVTSMRLPDNATKPTVIQTEVRLATKDQNSTVIVVIWEQSNPLYLLKNLSSFTILCTQPLCDPVKDENYKSSLIRSIDQMQNKMQCGIITDGLKLEDDEFIWTLEQGENLCFGFDDPDKPHILEWTCMEKYEGMNATFSQIEVDAMGSFSVLELLGVKVGCHICAENATKVIEFEDINFDYSSKNVGLFPSVSTKFSHQNSLLESEDVEINELDEDIATFKMTTEIPGFTISVIDNTAEDVAGREIIFLQVENLMIDMSRTYDGYYKLEVMVKSFQVDNHIYKCIHPVLLCSQNLSSNEPFLHFSAVQRLHQHKSMRVLRYIALRVLIINISLDRKTAEAIARLLQPTRKIKEIYDGNSTDWVTGITLKMTEEHEKATTMTFKDILSLSSTINLGRIYFEQLHLHPIRLSLTFTQELADLNAATEGLTIFQYIRNLPSLTNAPLTFTSFMVSHAFEAPKVLLRIVGTHYVSQLTNQFFSIIGSLAILNVPADFLTNIGTGVRDFFYEPINGLVHGPAQFIEGLETGSLSLAKGVIVGVVRGAANVTGVVNSNLAGLTDKVFINERNVYKRLQDDSLCQDHRIRTITDSLSLAGASVVHGVRSGALGIIEQPTLYASRFGAFGLAKGISKALVGAIIKPVIGVGDAAVLVMNHVSEVTSDEVISRKKRFRKALPRKFLKQRHSVKLMSHDKSAAKVQNIVTSNEMTDDVYIGHVNIINYLIISSERSLWVKYKTQQPIQYSWEDISHFGLLGDRSMQVNIFGQTGLKSNIFKTDSSAELKIFYNLLSMHTTKMGNSIISIKKFSEAGFSGENENISQFKIPGMKSTQSAHVFGSINNSKIRCIDAKDEINIVEQCFARVNVLSSEIPNFFRLLDEEAWSLIYSWGQVFSGLKSRRSIIAGFINGSGSDLQIKSAKVLEGGSPCYHIPSSEYNDEQGTLSPGGAMILFAWGQSPSLNQAGRVFMSIETNGFVCHLSDKNSPQTKSISLPDYEVGFLEKSYDDSGWWAKYWLIIH